MVGMDVIAFFIGLAFGRLMHNWRISIKYFAPVGFLLGYSILSLIPNIAGLLVGSAFIGIANGVGVPYLNTIASIKGGKESTTTVMPLLSAALYLGQFISPILVMPTARLCFPNDMLGAWKVAVLLCVCFCMQTLLTRRFHRLPPAKKE